jgi:hypothetical protein
MEHAFELHDRAREYARSEAQVVAPFRGSAITFVKADLSVAMHLSAVQVFEPIDDEGAHGRTALGVVVVRGQREQVHVSS